MLNALLKLLKMAQPLQIFEGGHKWEVSDRGLSGKICLTFEVNTGYYGTKSSRATGKF